uniref:RNA-binding region-containing protein 3 n=1 Tax=Saccoglossus kowalevskii TaxID=10224 RepID=A0ABM0M8T5_SACKO|nr:PREDICTED: RNA-binding protein 40-like [Saccoglossus kowalevskii]
MSMKKCQDDALLVRHLPAELNKSEKEELLKHFGANEVICMSDKGPMKNAAVAFFNDNTKATKALNRLHQLTVLNHRLVVEYANKLPQHLLPSQSIEKKNRDSSKENVEKEKEKKKTSHLTLQEHIQEQSKQFIGIAPSLGINYPSDPRLKYIYPPPTSDILTNILHAMIGEPQFYVQVLHLMNKMNLPPPFGALTPEPPIEHDGKFQEDIIEAAEMQISSEEESEFETDDEDKQTSSDIKKAPVKRPLQKKKSMTIKRPKLQQLLHTQVPTAPTGSSTSTYTPAEIFEKQEQQQVTKKMEFKLSESLPGRRVPERTLHQESSYDITEKEDNNTSESLEPSGFGRIEPVSVLQEEEESSEEETEESTEFITEKELKQNRLSKDETRKTPAFKNYDPGEPTTRLYVKNVSKQAEEKDLHYIFGRYIDFSSDLEKDM